ncbi:MAG TPA: hypothetical protein VG144_03105 [Gaiellaceae bacterium]|nr:hypothetical protein [Gaiellaceae bacterium]
MARRRRFHWAMLAGVTAAAALSFVPASAAADPSCAPTASTLAVVECARGPVVASLDRRYRSGKPRFRLSATRTASSSCRTSEFVFYAARDWLRLAPKLAEQASPCADYYISIPSLVADKTIARPNQAWRIRGLGPRFHAMAEIHWTTWQTWVRTTGRSWYEAGVEARRRMAAAGYDVALGDTWALNEFPSSVRRNLGTARSDARAFVHGLYEGDGRPAQGLVFVIGVMHGTNDASIYKSTLKSWFADTPFWLDMQRAVRFWGQEVYADARRWGVAGADPALRERYLNDFLQHATRLASVAPPEYDAARTFFARAHTPIANAGWQWPSGLGWTMLSGAQMQHFVSAQVDALRTFAAGRPGADRFGFAWAPNNELELPASEFTSQTGQLLDRLGAALSEPADACYESCYTDVEGATFTNAWRIFISWEQQILRGLRLPLVRSVRSVVSQTKPRR